MSQDLNHPIPATLAERKEKLIREGAAYRAAVRGARDMFNKNLRTEALARGLIAHLTGNAYAVIGNLLGGKRGNLQTLLPLVVSGVSLMLKARLLLPMWRSVGVIGAVGAGAWLLFRRKKPLMTED
ncbi:hypothetical protein RCH09_000221 [Actimicrobium sp. GrIS 1.19]|uniref:hypothetical protein n=1 Tax=Actimicrobium sp. GrIS 1.19 TaxID=3071708 RepID=UPI002DFDBF2C|nr:hypothetical protein [Actimicrobium sp. GrIS 1.19]